MSADLAPFLSLAATAAEASSADTIFAAAADAAQTTIGYGLFTVMRFDAARMEVARVYSSNPEAYPAGGRKPKRDTAWGRHVLIEGRPLVGPDEASIRSYFADADVILALGLTTVLNMPIRLGGETLGTINLLRNAPPYQDADMAPAQLIAAILAAPLVRIAP